MLSWQQDGEPIRADPQRARPRLLGLVADEAERWQPQQSWWEQSEFVMQYVRVLTH